MGRSGAFAPPELPKMLTHNIKVAQAQISGSTDLNHHSPLQHTNKIDLTRNKRRDKQGALSQVDKNRTYANLQCRISVRTLRINKEKDISLNG